MIELTNEERTIIVNVLNQVSIPVNQAPQILALIDKLKVPVDLKVEETPAA